MTAYTFAISEEKPTFSAEELSQIDLAKVPKHIAIIMDGNRRWAKQHGLPPLVGHWKGAETLTDVLKGASELGVKTLTVYAFSTENWRRPQDEVEDLMSIFELYLMRKKEHMVKEGVHLDSIGNLNQLPQKVLNAFYETKKATEHCDRIRLVLALNYGARDEIKRAVVKMFEEKLPIDQITEEAIASRLDSAKFGDPELLIRTSGEMRMSNFLLWQISYAEIISEKALWPEYSRKKLLRSIVAYQKRNRRLGE